MDVLFDTAFTWREPVPWIEVVGDATALLMVWCLVRQVVWTWPMSLVSTVCLALLFFHIDLDANAWLQGIFFVLAVWGWREWSRRGDHRPTTRRSVRHFSTRDWAGFGTAFPLIWLAVFLFLGEVAESARPLWDSCAFALGVLATYGQVRKLVESWLLWIVADLISVPLFWGQGGRLTAVLYAILAAVSLVGLCSWMREIRGPPTAIATEISGRG